MNKVTNTTRAPQKGKFIYCPNCGAMNRVFHFSWSACTCQDCNSMVDKLDWFVEDPKFPPRTDRNIMSLIFDRSFVDTVHAFNEKHLAQYGFYLDEVDASGSRTAWHFMPNGCTDYDDAIDLPPWAYEDFCTWLYERHKLKPEDFSICRRASDPGLGIMLPEDFEMLERGELPDGCIRFANN